MNQKQVKIAEFFRTGNFRQPRLVLLDQTIAKSIDEVVWYHYCYEKEAVSYTHLTLPTNREV